jgi:hypothetical protein
MIHVPPGIANEARKLSWKWVRTQLFPNQDLKKRIETLEAQLGQQQAFERLKAEMVYSKEDDGVYWKTDGSGPYCPTCLHADHRDILLAPGATSGVYACPIHGTSYWMRSYREQRSNHSSRPRYRSWPKLRAEMERRSRSGSCY